MTQTLWMARHGNRLDFVNPPWFNTAKRRYDPPLSEDGFMQAQHLAERLKSENIKHIFVSPFLRAIQTAYPVAQKLDLSLKLEAGLSEWLNPDWMTEHPETHPLEWLKSQYSRIDDNYSSKVRAKYPETEDQVYRRTGETINQLITEFSDNLLLVGHSVSVIGMTRKLLGEDLDIKVPLCSLFKMVKQDQTWNLILKGDTEHLQ